MDLRVDCTYHSIWHPMLYDGSCLVPGYTDVGKGIIVMGNLGTNQIKKATVEHTCLSDVRKQIYKINKLIIKDTLELLKLF